MMDCDKIKSQGKSPAQFLSFLPNANNDTNDNPVVLRLFWRLWRTYPEASGFIGASLRVESYRSNILEVNALHYSPSL